MKINNQLTNDNAAREAGQIQIRCWDEGSSCSFVLRPGGKLEVIDSGGIPVENLVKIKRLGLMKNLVKRIAMSFNCRPGCEYSVEATARHGIALFDASSGKITFTA